MSEFFPAVFYSPRLGEYQHLCGDSAQLGGVLNSFLPISEVLSAVTVSEC